MLNYLSISRIRLASLFFVSLVTLIGTISFSAIEFVPYDLSDFRDSTMTRTEIIRVPTVRVVAVDYDLIGNDFFYMKKRSGESAEDWKSRIDRWLVAYTGFIAVSQTKQHTVNSEIPTDDDKYEAFRPKGYRRAYIINMGRGLMDAKGVGAEDPRQIDHANGLATLGEVIREFIYEKAVNLIFKHSHIKAATVGSYAILDYGFDVINSDGTRDRAGYILRQAHKRSELYNSNLPSRDSMLVEKTLRKYGITSAGQSYADREDGKKTQDTLNIQGRKGLTNLEIVDFGAYLAVEHFKNQVYSNGVYDSISLLDPSSSDFVQPDPSLQVRLEEWGNFGRQDPKYDKLWRWSHELATAWAEGRADRSSVETHLQNFLKPIKDRLFSGLSCKQIFQ